MHDQHDLISVVIATYNRSNVLRYAIETVLMQTYSNWELIIVGDCCTDDTKELVESFKHEKIRFINLEKNIGEQSGPNNYGVSIARGKYIAFLNHDDLWFPDHLEKLLEKLKAGNVDLVYSLYFIAPVEKKINLIHFRKKESHSYKYDSPASTWLFKKELYNTIGPWRYFKDIHDVPSQDWLNRVFRSGKIAVVNEVQVIAIQSGSRKNSYKNGDFRENEFYFDAIKNNSDKLLKEIYLQQCILLKEKDNQFLYHIKAFLRNVVLSILNFFGIRLGQLMNFIKNPQKGSFINDLRKTRGLPKI